MTPQEFGPEIARLFEGWKKADDLTPARLTAYFERYGSLPVEVWRAVVTRALMLPNGMPYDNQLDKLVNEVETEQQQRRAESVRGRGQGASYVATLEKASTLRSHHGRFWMTIVRGEIEECLTPPQVAELLEHQSWPSELLATIDLLKASSDWRSFHAANAPPLERKQYQPKPTTSEQETLRWDLNH